MATQDLSEVPREAVDRSQRSGSIGMVLLVAIVLVGAAVALLFIGRTRAEPYIIGLLAVLAVIGVFSLFAIAAGILRMPGKEVNPLIKAVTDTANDGLVVSDPAGRVVYANATYLNLVNAVDANDVRPVERVSGGVHGGAGKPPRAGGRAAPAPARVTGALAAAARAAARHKWPRGALHGLDSGRRHPRPRTPGKRVPGAAARDRLARPCAGRLLLHRCRRQGHLCQCDPGRVARPRPGGGRLGRAHGQRDRRR